MFVFYYCTILIALYNVFHVVPNTGLCSNEVFSQAAIQYPNLQVL